MKKPVKNCIECGSKINGFAYLHHINNTILKTTYYCTRCYCHLGKPKPLSLKQLEEVELKTNIIS